jgi:hypothetical protein
MKTKSPSEMDGPRYSSSQTRLQQVKCVCDVQKKTRSRTISNIGTSIVSFLNKKTIQQRHDKILFFSLAHTHAEQPYSMNRLEGNKEKRMCMCVSFFFCRTALLHCSDQSLLSENGNECRNQMNCWSRSYFYV